MSGGEYNHWKQEGDGDQLFNDGFGIQTVIHLPTMWYCPEDNILPKAVEEFMEEDFDQIFDAITPHMRERELEILQIQMKVESDWKEIQHEIWEWIARGLKLPFIVQIRRPAVQYLDVRDCEYPCGTMQTRGIYTNWICVADLDEAKAKAIEVGEKEQRSAWDACQSRQAKAGETA